MDNRLAPAVLPPAASFLRIHNSHSTLPLRIRRKTLQANEAALNFGPAHGAGRQLSPELIPASGPMLMDLVQLKKILQPQLMDNAIEALGDALHAFGER